MTDANEQRATPSGNRGGAERPTAGPDQSPGEHQGQRPGIQLPLPGMPRVPLPTGRDALYLGGIAALAAAELIEWPIAVAVAVGHEIVSRFGAKAGQRAA